MQACLLSVTIIINIIQYVPTCVHTCSVFVIIHFTLYHNVGIFHKAMTSKNVGFDKELIATRVLPYLIPLSIQTTLNKNQVAISAILYQTTRYNHNLLIISFIIFIHTCVFLFHIIMHVTHYVYMQ